MTAPQWRTTAPTFDAELLKALTNSTAGSSPRRQPPFTVSASMYAEFEDAVLHLRIDTALDEHASDIPSPQHSRLMRELMRTSGLTFDAALVTAKEVLDE